MLGGTKRRHSACFAHWVNIGHTGTSWLSPLDTLVPRGYLYGNVTLDANTVVAISAIKSLTSPEAAGAEDLMTVLLIISSSSSPASEISNFKKDKLSTK